MFFGLCNILEDASPLRHPLSLPLVMIRESMFGLKFPCINKTIQSPLKKYSKLKDFFTHTVFQDTFLRETEKQKEGYNYIFGQ